MFAAFSRSWRLTKLSFSVIGADKEMLLFPLLGGIFSLLYTIALIWPTILVDLNTADGLGALEYVVLFLAYFGLAFIATFFNVCVVYTTRTRFEGGDATFMESIQFAMSRLGQIVAWALVSATVGLLLRMLDQVAERFGAIGEAILRMIVGLLGMAWSVITLFVIPTMVYENVGPKEAIKRSADTLRQTWGESLIRHYGLGLIQFMFIMLGVFLSAGLFAMLGQTGFGIGLAIMLSFVWFIGVIMVFSVANTVFNTALYAYANGGKVQGGFDEDTIQGAFRQKG